MTDTDNQTDSTPEVEINKDALRAELEQIVGTDLPAAVSSFTEAQMAVDAMEFASIVNPIRLSNLRAVMDTRRDEMRELISRRDSIRETLSNGRVAKLEERILSAITAVLAETQADWEQAAGVVMGQFTVLIYDTKGELRDTPRLVMNSSFTSPSAQMKYQLRSGHRPFTARRRLAPDERQIGVVCAMAAHGRHRPLRVPVCRHVRNLLADAPSQPSVQRDEP